MLNENNINYCHWKSNSHLNKALEGKTDLDVLVSKNQKKEFEKILDNFSFIKIITNKLKSTFNVYDYLGFDLNTNRLVHLHLHYVVVLGEKYTKNYFLPIEDLFFKDNIQIDNIKTPNPNLELLLLIIRMHLKLGLFDILSYLKHKNIFPKQIMNEFLILNSNFDLDCFKEYIVKIGLAKYSEKIIKIKSNIESNRYSNFSCFVNKTFFLKILRDKKKEKGLMYLIKKFYLSVRYFKYTQKIIKPPKKILPKGVAIAFIGADGSGKSTIVADISKWINWKIEVKQIYMGVPKSSIFLYILNNSRRVIRKCSVIFSNGYLIKINRYFMSYQWIYIGYVRYRNSKKINRYIKKGKIVIIDRYPINLFDSMNEPMDRPRIKKMFSKNTLLSRFEEYFYNRINMPDFIFSLKADIDTLRNRKSNIDMTSHLNKVNAINNIKSNPNLFVVDGTQAYQDVLSKIKKQIWRKLIAIN